MKPVVLVIFACSFPAAVAAGEFRFHYDAQNLAVPEGVEQLHGRLETAANAYCRKQYITLNVREVQACSRELMEQVVRQIGNGRLAVLHEDHDREHGSS